MPLLHAFLGLITLQSILLYFGIAFVFWYLAYAVKTFLNGGHVDRGTYWVFICFQEEMEWFLPGGLTKRTDYVREITKPRTMHDGFIGKYSYSQIRELNLYDEVARTSLGNGFYFWGVHVILCFFLWPLALCALFLLIVIGILRILGTRVYSALES